MRDVLLILAAFFLSLFFPYDPDLGWHLKYGEHFVQTGSVVRTNIFTQTLAGYPWTNISWGIDVLNYLLFNSFGFWGLTIAGALVVALMYGLLIKTYKSGFWESALLLPFFLWTCDHVIKMAFRGQVLSMLFVVCVSVLFENYRSGKKWMAWLLIPLFILWSNLHGEFVIGLLILWVWAIYIREKKILLAATVASAATLIHPFGIDIYKEVVRFSLNSDMGKIVEWRAAEIGSDIWWKTILLGISYIFAVTWSITQKKKSLIIYQALGGVFLFMCLFSRRYLPMAFLLNAPIFIEYLRSIRPKNYHLAFVFAASIFGLFFITQFSERIARNKFLDMNWRRYCLEYLNCSPDAAEHVIKLGLNEKKILTDYDWGGWLMWNYPQISPYVDGRMHRWEKDGYSPFNDYYQTELGLTEADKFEFDVVMISKRKRLFSQMLQLAALGKWQYVYEDDFTGIFEKVE